MYFSAVFVALVAFASHLGVLAQTSGQTTLAYDNTYDNADLSLNSVACSNGPGDLESKGYTTLGSLPTFPNVGGVFTVTGWDSPACGTCYAVTYGSNTVNILAVDKSTTGFTVSEEAMNTLTNNQAVALGRVDVTWVETTPSACKMPN